MKEKTSLSRIVRNNVDKSAVTVKYRLSEKHDVKLSFEKEKITFLIYISSY